MLKLFGLVISFGTMAVKLVSHTRGTLFFLPAISSVAARYMGSAGTMTRLTSDRLFSRYHECLVNDAWSVNAPYDRYRWQKDISDNNKCIAVHCPKFIRNCQ
jgi:hypothetical protein